MDELRDRLRQKYERLTPSERRIAEWLERSFEQLAFLTVNEVSQVTGVSEATIVRFARKLDFASFSDLQSDVQAAMQRQYSVGRRLAVLDMADGPLSTAYERDLENLRRTYEQIDEVAFEGAVKAIAHAPKVAVIGLRASTAAAVYIAFALNLIRPQVTQLRIEMDNMHDQLLDLAPGDVLIAISLQRPARKTLEVVQDAAEHYGVTVVAIISSALSLLAQKAQYALVASSEGTFSSYAATFSLAGALLDGVATRLRSSATDRLARLDAANSQDVYSN
jgi:DNA-binding MurR/RpiR family transcriptional regulator